MPDIVFVENLYSENARKDKYLQCVSTPREHIGSIALTTSVSLNVIIIIILYYIVYYTIIHIMFCKNMHI